MKTVISLSGGLDSATLLAYLIHREHEVSCVSFIYGSNHNKIELECAKKLAIYYKVPHKIWDLTALFSGFDSSLMADNDEAIPQGHYESESMKSTVVPGRNMIFASILAAYAESQGIEKVVLGIHAGDHFIYPDCRPIFKTNMGKAISSATDNKVELITPFLWLSKTEIVSKASMFNVPFLLTRTCYETTELACGKCGACVERLEAFAANNIKDPIGYAE